MAWLEPFRARARALGRETQALYFAARDPRTPWYARLLVAAIVAYALSPVDLIPDFIPVLGLLDDLLLLLLGIAWAIRMVPAAVLADARDRARSAGEQPEGRVVAAIILGLWAALTVALLFWAWRAWGVAD